MLSSSQKELVPLQIVPRQALSPQETRSSSFIIPSVPRIVILPHQEIMDFLEHYHDLFNFHYAFSCLLPLHSFSKQISELHKVFPVNNTHLAWTKEKKKRKRKNLFAASSSLQSSLQLKFHLLDLGASKAAWFLREMEGTVTCSVHQI